MKWCKGGAGGEVTGGGVRGLTACLCRQYWRLSVALRYSAGVLANNASPGKVDNIIVLIAIKMRK